MSETRHKIRLAMLRLSGAVAVLCCVSGGLGGAQVFGAASAAAAGTSANSNSDLEPPALATGLAANQQRSNGVISLEWNNPALPPQTTISNLTTKTAYDAGTNQSITLGRQPVGTNVYVAFATYNGAPALSNLLTNNVQPDTNRLFVVYRPFLRCMAGMLQASTNAVTYFNVRSVTNGEQIELSGPEAALFYRVWIK